MKRIEFTKAIKLRQSGYSIGEISRELKVSRSTASTWVKGAVLSNSAREILALKTRVGQQAVIKYQQTRTKNKIALAKSYAGGLLSSLHDGMPEAAAFCAMLYICEGAKDTRLIAFTNSDPVLFAYFMKLFRRVFTPDESKFSVQVHLHDYHDIPKQLKFWSKTLTIPLSQFTKPYLKRNTGIAKKEGYPGCARVRYYDSVVTRKLQALAAETMRKGL